jgi:hypothetical protein
MNPDWIALRRRLQNGSPGKARQNSEKSSQPMFGRMVCLSLGELGYHLLADGSEFENPPDEIGLLMTFNSVD